MAVEFVCGVCDLVADQPWDVCQQCGAHDQCYWRKPHCDICGEPRHPGQPCVLADQEETE